MASRKPQQSKEHRFSQANLSAYIDNQLAPKELARVARHLEECDACRRELAELRRTVALVSQGDSVRWRHGPHFRLEASRFRTVGPASSGCR